MLGLFSGSSQVVSLGLHRRDLFALPSVSGGRRRRFARASCDSLSSASPISVCTSEAASQMISRRMGEVYISSPLLGPTRVAPSRVKSWPLAPSFDVPNLLQASVRGAAVLYFSACPSCFMRSMVSPVWYHASRDVGADLLGGAVRSYSRVNLVMRGGGSLGGVRWCAGSSYLVHSRVFGRCGR